MTAPAPPPEMFPEPAAPPEPPRRAIMLRDRGGWYWEPDRGDRWPDLLAAATAATQAGMGPCVMADWNRQ